MIGISIGISLRTTQAGSPPVAAAPVNTVAPSISGTPQQGNTLTADPGTWTGYPYPTFTYQWKRGGVDISGATNQTYVLVSGDVGANITVAVTGSNASGTPAAVTSGAVGPVIIAAPSNTAAPVVSGTTTSGQVLSVTTGTWSNSPSSFAYQWRRDGASISGATASTYTLTTGDIGALMSCTVAASNAGGTASPVTSNSVGPVASAGGGSTWILAAGAWNDTGVWDDADVWKDA